MYIPTILEKNAHLETQTKNLIDLSTEPTGQIYLMLFH
jgi:hypothetical protein